MARQMVTKFGMSRFLCPLESQSGEVFLGRLTTRSEYLEAIASRIDVQVRAIVEDCYNWRSG